jgi:acetylornithine/succinyldiaminopimelate/putrescine aminotransferase
LAAAAGLVVLDTVQTPQFLGEIREKGEKIQGILRSWNHPKIKEIRGRGLMIGVDITVEAWPVLEACLAQGLLILSAGARTLRFLPPYTITNGEIDQGLGVLRGVLNKG